MSGKRAFSASTISGGVVDRQGRLGEERKIGGIGNGEPGDIVDGFDQGHRAFGHLAEGADHLGVAGVADEDDVAAFGDQPLGLAMDLGDERAGRIDITEAAVQSGGGHGLGHAVGREHHRPVVGNLVELVDEHRAELAQAIDDKAVVDDLVADVDRRSELLERQLDDLDRAVDAGAESARRGDQHVKGRQFIQGAGHVRHRLQP